MPPASPASCHTARAGRATATATPCRQTPEAVRRRRCRRQHAAWRGSAQLPTNNRIPESLRRRGPKRTTSRARRPRAPHMSPRFRPRHGSRAPRVSTCPVCRRRHIAAKSGHPIERHQRRAIEHRAAPRPATLRPRRIESPPPEEKTDSASAAPQLTTCQPKRTHPWRRVLQQALGRPAIGTGTSATRAVPPWRSGRSSRRRQCQHHRERVERRRSPRATGATLTNARTRSP
mmetsp:Transcript_89222/g.257267  ORF Transcript_89222/g.257267 Transcript_89222/m.257267 type:complete len:232 (-) Transcript_89222:551-1246(-)